MPTHQMGRLLLHRTFTTGNILPRYDSTPRIGVDISLSCDDVSLTSTNSSLLDPTTDTTSSGTVTMKTTPIHQFFELSYVLKSQHLLPGLPPGRVNVYFLVCGIMYRRPGVMTPGPLEAVNERRNFDFLQPHNVPFWSTNTYPNAKFEGGLKLSRQM